MLQEYEALAAYPERTRGTIPWGAVSKATWEEGPPSQVRPEGVVLVLQVNTLVLRGHLTCCCFLLDPAHAVLLSQIYVQSCGPLCVWGRSTNGLSGQQLLNINHVHLNW